MSAYPVYTIEGGKVAAGTTIDTLSLKGAGIEIPAIIVGEEGRGRQRGVLPVGSPPMEPCPVGAKGLRLSQSTCFKCGEAIHDDVHPPQGEVYGRLMAAELAQTKAGKPKLAAKPRATTMDAIIVVLRTPIGFRGGNSHTGDRTGEVERDYAGREVPAFQAFPGDVLAEGRIAQGAAGRMGSGRHLVAVIPQGTVFRTGYSGRLYGGPAAHYYLWNGERLLTATWEERAMSDLF